MFIQLKKKEKENQKKPRRPKTANSVSANKNNIQIYGNILLQNLTQKGGFNGGRLN